MRRIILRILRILRILMRQPQPARRRAGNTRRKETIMIDYETLKLASKQIRRETRQTCKVEDLIALARGNDPFYFGTEADLDMAQWFADIWKKFEYIDGVHLRRIHYQITAQSPALLLPDGTPYENTDACWRKLEEASKRARYLEYVPAEAFVDRRNREHQIFADTLEHPAPSLYINDYFSASDMTLPEFPALPRYQIGASYLDTSYTGRQPFLLEIWCEKSTMDDVLLPLCQHYHINYVVSAGEQSITSALNLVKRAQAVKTPIRIFYISDFDPAGASIPLTASRKIEFFCRKYAPDRDVQVFPLALTVAQCQQYRLPRTPIKDEERRKERFEARHGEGATELDALEALHAGELARIVEAAVKPYYDETLARRAAQQKARLQEAMRNAAEAVYAQHQAEIDALREEYEPFAATVAAKMADLQARLESVWLAIRNDLQEYAPDVNDYPVPMAEVDGGDPAGALYVSERDYFAQLAAYKAFQGRAFKVSTKFPLN